MDHSQNMMKLVCGVDEAGRGPVIGPLVIGCVVLDPKGKRKLKALKVRDSKKVSPSRRQVLDRQIKDIAIEWRTGSINPADIDRRRKKISLNVIEARKIAELIVKLESAPKTIIVDAADTVPENYKEKIIEGIKMLDPDFQIPRIVSEHHADDTYIEASAASIIAKVERDRAIEDLKQEYGEFGSGYPSDERTMKFIRKWIREGKLPPFVRRSWNTLNRAKQMSLDEF